MSIDLFGIKYKNSIMFLSSDCTIERDVNFLFFIKEKKGQVLKGRLEMVSDQKEKDLNSYSEILLNHESNELRQ